MKTNPVILGFRRQIKALEQTKLKKRPPCGACQSTGEVEHLDPGGNVQYVSGCFECDMDMYNANISVKQDRLRYLIKLAQEIIQAEREQTIQRYKELGEPAKKGRKR